jgi:hypothetical protein
MRLSFLKRTHSPKIYDCGYTDSTSGIYIVTDPVKYRFYQQEYLRSNPGIKWRSYIPVLNTSIQYLEIGVHKGENIIDVANSYAQHPLSKIHCVDPWEDYQEYTEYKKEQPVLFDMFKANTKHISDKCIKYRGFSDNIVPKFDDNYFDIIFVDGNHEMEFVYRDGVMSFQKVKSGGYIIFDDYSNYWPQTMTGIDRFLKEYSEWIEIIARPTSIVFGCSPQVIIRKL